MIDIRTMPDLLETINAILNNGGLAEIKREKWKTGEKITVVEQTRSVKGVFPTEK